MLHEYETTLEVPFRAELPRGDAYATFEVSAAYEYERPLRARWGEPSEGGYVDIVSVMFRRDGSNVWRNLPRRAFDYVRLCDAIYDAHEAESDDLEYADYKYDQMREERDMRRAAE